MTDVASRDVVLLGASVRALAFSVLRAGARCVAYDLFGDADLDAYVETSVLPLAQYPEGWKKVAPLLGGRPWCYTGGLENYPGVLDTLAAAGELWGNPSAVTQGCRDPWKLSEVARAAKARVPALSATAAGLPTDGSWLVKPLASGGGIGISPWRGGILKTGRYLQQRVPGLPHAATFVANPHGTPNVELLGITRQWVGEMACAAPEFYYCGSVGPRQVTQAARACLSNFAALCTSTFGLRGVFGVDFLLDGDTIWILEINPRWTASVEVLEIALNTNVFTRHRHVFMANRVQTTLEPWPDTNHLQVGKAILFARRPCRVSAAARCFDRCHWLGGFTPGAAPLWAEQVVFADIPHQDTVFDNGQPILTMFTRGSNADNCETHLQRALLNFEAKWVSIV